MDDETSATPIITTACNHTYHPNCLTSWGLQSNTCPTCRGVLAPSDNPWGSMSVYERITNFLFLVVMNETYSTTSSEFTQN
jgi:hypothetical protein